MAVIAVLVADLVVVGTAGGSGPVGAGLDASPGASVPARGPAPGPPVPVPAGLVAAVTNVPASVFDAVGAGSGTGVTPPHALTPTQPPLRAGSRPEVFYVGMEFCPYCATERWPIVVALSRFGTWSHLGQMASSPDDVYPGTQTFTFDGAHYTSPYLVLDAKEIISNEPDGQGGYQPLQSLSSAESALYHHYDAPPFVPSAGAVPFVDLANAAVVSGSSFSPGLLSGLSRKQIALGLTDPHNPATEAIVATANDLTAYICSATAQQPQAVCASPGVTAAAAAIGLAQ